MPTAENLFWPFSIKTVIVPHAKGINFRGVFFVARKTSSSKVGRKAPSGANTSIKLVLAGFTALVIVVIAAVAVFSTTGGNANNFTPNDEGLIPVGYKAPSFSAETVKVGSGSVGEGG